VEDLRADESTVTLSFAKEEDSPNTFLGQTQTTMKFWLALTAAGNPSHIHA
jgi:hypothetical protein